MAFRELKRKLIVSGFIGIDSDDNIELRDRDKKRDGILIKNICNKLKIKNPSECDHDTYIDEEDKAVWEPVNLKVHKILFRFYVSDIPVSLAKAKRGYLEQILGGKLKAHAVNYGYSEYTIMGMTVETFKIGNHDIENIMKNYVGKYINIEICY